MVATKMTVAVIAILVVQTVVVAIVLMYFRRVATLSLLGDLVVSNSPGLAKGQHHNIVLLSIDLQQQQQHLMGVRAQAIHTREVMEGVVGTLALATRVTDIIVGGRAGTLAIQVMVLMIGTEI